MFLQNLPFKGHQDSSIPLSLLQPHARGALSRHAAGFHGGRVRDSAFTIRRGRIATHVAHTDHHHFATDQLIKERYEWRGYQSVASAAPRSSVNIHGRKKTFLAASGTEPLGTISIMLDSEAGLAADGLFKKEIDHFRKLGCRVCEMGRLAISPTDDSREVVATLFNIAYIYTRVLNQASDTFIEVNPRHVNYYRRLLGFEVAAEERHCSRVDAPAILLRLDLAHADRQIEKLATGNRPSSGKTGSRSLYSSFLTKQEEARVIELSREPTAREIDRPIAFA
jgi:hypothetical protein